MLSHLFVALNEIPFFKGDLYAALSYTHTVIYIYKCTTAHEHDSVWCKECIQMLVKLKIMKIIHNGMFKVTYDHDNKDLSHECFNHVKKYR